MVIRRTSDVIIILILSNVFRVVLLLHLSLRMEKREHKNKTNYIWCIFFDPYYSSTDHTKDRETKKK